MQRKCGLYRRGDIVHSGIQFAPLAKWKSFAICHLLFACVFFLLFCILYFVMFCVSLVPFALLPSAAIFTHTHTRGPITSLFGAGLCHVPLYTWFTAKSGEREREICDNMCECPIDKRNKVPAYILIRVTLIRLLIRTDMYAYLYY